MVISEFCFNIQKIKQMRVSLRVQSIRVGLEMGEPKTDLLPIDC